MESAINAIVGCVKLKPLSNTHPDSIEAVIQILLENRAIKNKKTFLQPTHPSAITPKMVGISQKMLKKVVAQIVEHIEQKKQIVVYGDYDADGICATAVLWEMLFACWQAVHGSSTQGIPIPFIPHRIRHGYGLSTVAIDEIISAHKPDLLITVDNGIVAHDAIMYLLKKKIACIITDHHEPEEGEANEFAFPESVGVIHSTQLCGTTVAWLLARELAAQYKLPESYSEHQLDLCGLATIADQVPLAGYNRSFAYHGLRTLAKLQRIGLKELALSSGAKFANASVDETAVGFRLAPKINAVGRLDHGLEALRLLCTNSSSLAKKLAGVLTSTNETRQELTKDQLDSAFESAHEQVAAGEKIIIVESPEYHEGIIGLIASQLTEKFYLPSIAIAVQEEKGMLKASARSISGVHITQLLRSVRAHLLAVGGHPMAAGFSAEAQKSKLIRNELHALARKQIDPDLLEQTQVFDCVLPHELLKPALCEELQTLAPFGMGNPTPLFYLSGLTVVEVRSIGAAGNHLKIVATDTHKKPLTVMAWNKAHIQRELQLGSSIDCIVSLALNEFRSVVSVQATLQWWAPAT